jgi:hypothetical protein
VTRWMSFLRRKTRASEMRRVGEILFLREQDGPNERLLKERLVDLFRRSEYVRKGYLVVAGFGQESSSGVVLGLRTNSGDEHDIVDRVGIVFASICKTGDHLDVIFLTDTQEAQVIKVCTPFYVTSEPSVDNL